jgi:hypothetical protein
MPIIRYFVFVGGLLLALIFAAEQYLPAPVARADTPEPDRTTIRVRSARVLPEKIVFDTRPRADLPQIAQAEPLLEAQQQPVREAMAAMPAALPAKSLPATTKQEPPARPSLQSRPQAKRSARLSRRAPGPRLAFERQGPFFGDW